MIELKNLTTFRRYLFEKANLLVVLGDISPVISGMHVYNGRHGIEQPSTDLMPVLRELLAAVGLAAVSLADRESWGWSITFPQAPVGFFVGAEPEGMLCVRVKVAEEGRGAALIQRQKHNQPMTQSYLEPKGGSARELVQQYFREVEQTNTRLVVEEDGKGAFIHALPGGDFDAVSALTDTEILEFARKEVENSDVLDVGEVVLFYECRCSEEMISNMVGNMKETERLELWGDLKELEIECPRCSREYLLRRTERSGV